MEKQSLVLFVVALQSSGYTKSVNSVVIRIGADLLLTEREGSDRCNDKRSKQQLSHKIVSMLEVVSFRTRRCPPKLIENL